jgi:cholinesterase
MGSRQVLTLPSECKETVLLIGHSIANFGGDPSRIILFGQSAGGMSVDYYAYAWTKDPIVTGFIAESGSAANTAGSAQNLSAGWYMASQKLGCGGVEAGQKTLACMQSKPWRSIMDSIEKRGVTPNMGAGGFGPTVDNKLVFSDYAARKASGNFIKAPLIVGNANNEEGFYQLLAKARGQTLPMSALSPLASLMGCGPRSAALAREKAGVPVWRYIYQGEYPNQDIGIPGGAWHGSEIGIVFGTSEFLSHLPDSPEEKALGEQVRKAWTGFAKDPTHALDKMNWPRYDASKATVIHIGAVNSSAITFEEGSKTEATCS